MKHAARGQALVETCLAIPLVLIALSMLFWTVKYAVMSERMEADARYAQEILSGQNLYTQYSLDSLYDAVPAPGAPAPRFYSYTCPPPPPELISDAAPTTNNGITFPGLGLWHGKSVTSSCLADHMSFVGGNRTYLIGYQTASLSSQLEPPFELPMVSAITLNARSMSYAQAATVEDLALCYPEGAVAVGSSLMRGDHWMNTDGWIDATATFGPQGPGGGNPPALSLPCQRAKLHSVAGNPQQGVAVTLVNATVAPPYTNDTFVGENTTSWSDTGASQPTAVSTCPASAIWCPPPGWTWSPPPGWTWTPPPGWVYSPVPVSTAGSGGSSTGGSGTGTSAPGSGSTAGSGGSGSGSGSGGATAVPSGTSTGSGSNSG